jgi:hypothetical protein
MTRYRRSLSSAARGHPRLALTLFTRDIGIALSLKFLLLSTLYYTFDGGAKRGAHLDDAAVARSLWAFQQRFLELRHDR